MNIKRKRILEKKNETDGVIEGLIETKRKNITQQDLQILPLETFYVEQNSLTTSCITVTGSGMSIVIVIIFINNWHDCLYFSEIEKNLNGETVFDHIRNKAKSFQWFDNSSSTSYKQAPVPETFPFWNEPDLSIASTSCKKDSYPLNSDVSFTSDTEQPIPIEPYSFHNKECIKEESVNKKTCSITSTLSTPPHSVDLPITPNAMPSPLSTLHSDASSKMSSSGFFSMGNLKQTQPGKTSSCSSMKLATQLTEGDSIFGFKSVFSFLWASDLLSDYVP